MKIKYIFSAAVLLLILMFTACNADGPGIFYTIYSEEKIKESEISDFSVYRVTSDGTNLYVLAGAAVYHKAKSSTTDPWEKLVPPADGMRAVSLGHQGNTVYAVYEEESSGSITDTMYAITDLTTGILSATNIDLVSVDDSSSSYIFVSARTGNSSFDYYSYNGTTLNTLSTANSFPLAAAALANGNYYLAASNFPSNYNGSKLYNTNGTSAPSEITPSSPDLSSIAIGGLTENLLTTPDLI